MSDVRLGFVYIPVPDISKALSFYRDTLGFTEVAQISETTYAVKAPAAEVGLLIIEDGSPGLTPGPIFLVDSVDEFVKSHQEKISFQGEITDVPPGHYIDATDPAGNVLSIMDMSKVSPAEG